MHIVIAPVTPLQPVRLQPCIQTLPEFLPVYPLSITTGSPLPPLPHAYSYRRGQWNASQLLRWVARQMPREGDIRLGVHPGDLYVPGFNFVFGLAERRLQTAIVGLARLESPDPQQWHHRVVTEMLHEIGHLLGLEHCPRSHCTMHFSNTLEETDHKGPAFCSTCYQKIKRVTQRKRFPRND